MAKQRVSEVQAIGAPLAGGLSCSFHLEMFSEAGCATVQFSDRLFGNGRELPVDEEVTRTTSCDGELADA